MNVNSSLFSLALATLGMFTVPAAANAFTLSHISSDGYRHDGTAWGADNAYDALFPDSDSADDTAFVAESRFGDLGGAAEKEFKIFDHSDGDLDQLNFGWENGKSYNFSLEFIQDQGWSYSLFDFDTHEILASITGEFDAAFNNIFIRTRADQGNSMVVDNLFLNGTALNDSSAATDVTGEFAVDYLRIYDVSGPFTLTGTSTMSWTEDLNKPLRSALAYQIKVVNIEDTQSVPEPTLALGLTVGALAMTRLRRTR